MRLLLLACLLTLAQALSQTAPSLIEVRKSEYFAHLPQDECSILVRRIEDNEIALDTSSQLTFTRNLLLALDVPASSQLLVFSGTASQGDAVNSKNPRAIYFNDEVYIGMVPGGLVEMIGIDPQYGPVWYSFEKRADGEPPQALRDTDCFRCHNQGSGIPSMVMRNLIPNEAGGSSLLIGNNDSIGHHHNFATRFGGWYVTSIAPLSPSSEGLLTLTEHSQPVRKHITAGELYDPKLHMAHTSDVAAHLVHAHQLGFVNLVTEINTYARDGRVGFGTSSTQVTEPTEQRLIPMVDKLVRYLLFADEAPFPAGGITGLPAFLRDFSANRRASKKGSSLKDFDLKTRLFKHRCSYMIYTRQWSEMPPVAKTLAYTKLKQALSGEDAIYAYLPEAERSAIKTILLETLPDLPSDWRE